MDLLKIATDLRCELRLIMFHLKHFCWASSLKPFCGSAFLCFVESKHGRERQEQVDEVLAFPIGREEGKSPGSTTPSIRAEQCKTRMMQWGSSLRKRRWRSREVRSPLFPDNMDKTAGMRCSRDQSQGLMNLWNVMEHHGRVSCVEEGGCVHF